MTVISTLAPLPPAFALADEPSAEAFATYQASAHWAVVKGRTVVVYQVIAARTIESKSGTVQAWAAVGQTRCSIRQWANERCDAVADGPEIPLDDFTIDPALNTANLRFRYKGFLHRVEWRAQTEAEVYPHHYLFPESTFAGAGLIVGRQAFAKGRLFGDRLGRDGLRNAELAAAAFGFGRG